MSFSPLLFMAYIGGINSDKSSLVCEGSEVVEPIRDEFGFTSEIDIQVLFPNGIISFNEGASRPDTKCSTISSDAHTA